jgi:hypothetical protein
MKRTSPSIDQPPAGREQYIAQVVIIDQAIEEASARRIALSEEAKSLAPRQWRNRFDVETGVSSADAEARERRFAMVQAELKFLRREVRQLEADRVLLRQIIG